MVYYLVFRTNYVLLTRLSFGFKQIHIYGRELKMLVKNAKIWQL